MAGTISSGHGSGQLWDAGGVYDHEEREMTLEYGLLARGKMLTESRWYIEVVRRVLRGIMTEDHLTPVALPVPMRFRKGVVMFRVWFLLAGHERIFSVGEGR